MADKIIKAAEGRPLSDKEIEHLTNGKCKIIEYKQLAHMHSADEMFTNHNACVILYESKANYGKFFFFLS